MKKKTWTRLLALFLSVVMAATSLPAAALAADGGAATAKAQLGTDAAYSGDKVPLSNALYTFTAKEDGTYSVSANVPGTETTVYLNYTTGNARYPNRTAEGTVGITVEADDQNGLFRIKTGGSYLYFVDSLHLSSAERRFDRMGKYVASYAPGYRFALFQAAASGENAAIPGYTQLASLDQIKSGGKYLIAHNSPDGENGTWYVLYPSSATNTVNDAATAAAHVAKVVVEAGGEEPGPVDPTDPPAPGAPTKGPVIDANNDLYQVVVMCQENRDHFWSYTNDHNWSTTPDQFKVGEIRENDLDNGTAEQYPYICPVTPAYTLDECLTNVNRDHAGHRMVTTAENVPVAYYYWNAEGGWQLLRDKQPDPNVTFNQTNAKHEGTLTVTVTCAAEPGPVPSVEPTVEPTPEPSVAPEKPDAPAGQPTGEYTVPNDKLSGTGSSEPMSDADVHSYFRIPALVTLPNGWLVAASDARWPNTNDSPNNLDTIVSVSKDGGETWDWEIVNYFADFAPIQGPTYYPGTSKTASASFIDPALTVDSSGKIWMAVDLQPPYVNLNQAAQKAGSGFDENGYLMVGNIPESAYAGIVGSGATGLTPSAAAALAEAHYLYRVDLGDSTRAAEKDGETVKLFPIFHRDGKANETGYYVDAFFDLWYDYGEDGGLKPVLCLQKDRADTWVQANLFYLQSDWKAYSTSYLMIRSAEVVGDELVWSDPMLINHGVKKADERFLVFCPGRGTIVPLADGGERIMFQLYDNATSAQRASAVWSDDGGKTWTRGERTEAGKMASESQIVHLPDGKLRMYSRNDKKAISYADSADGGVTWGATQYDDALSYCGNCMVSFINLDGVLVGPDNKTYENLILASYPKGKPGTSGQNRNDGVIRIGYFNDDAGQTVTWLNGDAVRFVDRYNYSCLTQLPGSAGVAVLYEKDTTVSSSKGVMAMNFVKLTAEDLLGAGWLFASAKPETPVTLKVDASLIDLDFGGSRTVAVEYSPEDAQVTWTSSDESVAAVADGAITAVGAGTAVVTVTVTKGALTRSAEIPVLVQPESGELILPGQFADEVGKIVTPGKSGYLLTETEALAEGDYVIYAEKNSADSRMMHNSGTRTDHYRATVNEKILTGANHDQHEWTFTKSGEGYTIRSAGGKYLSTTESPERAGQLELKDEPTVFTVAYQGKGVWHIKCGEQYLGFSGGWRMQSGPDTLKLFSAHTTPDTVTYTVSADGLRALISALKLQEANYADLLALANKVYADEAEAQAALARIEEASRALYAQYRTGNVTRYTVTYLVDGEAIGATAHYAGEEIVPMAAPAKAGLVFAGWSGMPEDGRMPEGDLVLTAVYTGSGTSALPVVPEIVLPNPPEEEIDDPDTPLASLPFADVDHEKWYAQSIANVVAKGLMEGVDELMFAPDDAMTRGMMAQALYALAQKPEIADPAAFLDVLDGVSYADAVAWGAANGLIQGYSETEFGGEDALNRQQLAVLLYRYAAQVEKLDMGVDPTVLNQFSDSERISAWAEEAVAWAVGKQLIEGRTDGTVDPRAEITRAEAAAILDRFFKQFLA